MNYCKVLFKAGFLAGILLFPFTFFISGNSYRDKIYLPGLNKRGQTRYRSALFSQQLLKFSSIQPLIILVFFCISSNIG
jgi:hypothetical protein